MATVMSLIICLKRKYHNCVLNEAFLVLLFLLDYYKRMGLVRKIKFICWTHLLNTFNQDKSMETIHIWERYYQLSRFI